MAMYTIIRVYQVPADNRLQATDRMLEALTLGVEDDFHVKDVLREPDGKPGPDRARHLPGDRRGPPPRARRRQVPAVPAAPPVRRGGLARQEGRPRVLRVRSPGPKKAMTNA